MKSIQIEVNKIKPNPFKKEIGKGKLNEEQIQKLIEGYKQTTFHENLLARKNKKGEVELVYGHHRLEAVKRVYGKTHKISINIVDFNDEQMIIDLCRENLTQRWNEFRQEMDTVLLIRKYLEQKFCKGGLQKVKTGGRPKEPADSRTIAKFLSAEGKTISHSKVADLLRMNENLDKKILEKVQKFRGAEGQEEGVSIKQAEALSKIKDKKEQKDVLKAMKRSDEKLGWKQGQAITEYLKASDKTKEELRKGELELEDIKIENFKDELKKRGEEQKENNKGKFKVTFIKKYQRETGNDIGETNDKILKTCAKLNWLKKEGVIKELDFNTMYKILEAGQVGGKRYTQFMEMMMSGL